MIEVKKKPLTILYLNFLMHMYQGWKLLCYWRFWTFFYFKDDVNLSGYKKHLTSGSAPAPLTFAETELKLIKENDVGHSIFGWWLLFFPKNSVFVFSVRFFFTLHVNIWKRKNSLILSNWQCNTISKLIKSHWFWSIDHVDRKR